MDILFIYFKIIIIVIIILWQTQHIFIRDIPDFFLLQYPRLGCQSLGGNKL